MTTRETSGFVMYVIDRSHIRQFVVVDILFSSFLYVGLKMLYSGEVAAMAGSMAGTSLMKAYVERKKK